MYENQQKEHSHKGEFNESCHDYKFPIPTKRA